LQRFSPELVDSILALIGFAGQRTNEPKSEDAPDNLYAPVPEYDRVKGDFDQLVIPSFLEWLDMNPPLKWGAVTFAALGVAALLGGWRPGDKI
jgi:hypothetical protein